MAVSPDVVSLATQGSTTASPDAHAASMPRPDAGRPVRPSRRLPGSYHRSQRLRVGPAQQDQDWLEDLLRRTPFDGSTRPAAARRRRLSHPRSKAFVADTTSALLMSTPDQGHRDRPLEAGTTKAIEAMYQKVCGRSSSALGDRGVCRRGLSNDDQRHQQQNQHHHVLRSPIQWNGLLLRAWAITWCGGDIRRRRTYRRSGSPPMVKIRSFAWSIANSHVSPGYGASQIRGRLSRSSPTQWLACLAHSSSSQSS